ncbi:MAG: hypothetical protein D6820_12715, partial [Lentisphaerae bacterium]
MPNRRIMTITLATISSTIAAGDATAITYPHTILNHGDNRVVVALPDPDKGYYRGKRFDWSGIITHWEKQGHTFAGELKKPHNPNKHDGAAGPVEEFDMQGNASFQEAQMGEEFYKIGVGILIKNNEKYQFFRRYKVSRLLPWKIQTTANSITFTQKLDNLRGWGWIYSKTLRWHEERKDTLQIMHTLTNTGSRALTTEHYNHSMFCLDDTPVGSSYRLTIPMATGFPLKPRAAEKVKVIPPNTLVFREPVLKGSFWTQVTIPDQAGGQRLDPLFVISVPQKGLQLEVAMDRPLS